MKYKEAQIHGEVSFEKHVARLVAHQRHRHIGSRIKAVCNKFKWKFSWMDEEQARMAAEEKDKLGAAAWEARIASLLTTGVPDAPDVPEGMCRTGCGRKVAPGLTRAG